MMTVIFLQKCEKNFHLLPNEYHNRKKKSNVKYNKEAHLTLRKAGEREKLIGVQMNEEVEWLPIFKFKIHFNYIYVVILPY